MLTFFPTPYTDEILYSVLARYHVRSGNISPKFTLQELFGSMTVTATVDLPSHLDALVRNLPPCSKHTVESLLQQHTLYPLYAPFISPSRAELVAKSMKEHTWGDIHTRAGIMASSVKTPSHLRFCPACLREDEARHGEAYWHRVHQAPGILVCPNHLTLLQDSTVMVRGANKHEFIPASSNNCLSKLHRFELDGSTLKKIINLAYDVVWLLNNHITPKDGAWFQQQYKSRLIDKGLAMATGRVRQAELANAFESFCGDTLLKLIDSTISYQQESNWLSSIVRKHRKSFHPLRHLLLMRYLEHPVNSFFDIQTHFKPFGYGPWRCFNGAAKHYLKPVVASVQVTWSRDAKKPLGIFSCKCGFIYSTTIPPLMTSQHPRIGKVIAFGKLWERKLKECIEAQKLGLRETARRLRVDPLTVKRHAERLKLTCRWQRAKSSLKCTRQASCHNTFDTAKNAHRKAWTRLRRANVLLSKTALRRKAPAIYIWLYRHDRVWLDKHSPSKVTIVVQTGRVAWEERDRSILPRVHNAVQKLLDLLPPVRVTFSKVGKIVGLLPMLERHLNKLPLSQCFLQTVTESQTQYQVRRVRWAADVLRSRDEVLAEWKVVRLAGVKPSHAKEVEQAIEFEVHQKDYMRARKMVG